MMFGTLLAAVLSLAGSASAVAIAGVPDLAPNGFNGIVYVNYTCDVQIIGKTTFGVKFQGWAPSLVSSGGSFKITGGHGSLIAPPVLTYGANLLGAKSADVTISQLNIARYTGGITPATVNVFPTPIVIKDVTWTVGQSFTINLPVNGRITTPAFRVSGSGAAALKLSTANATIQLKDKNGKDVQKPLKTTCSTPVPAVILGTVNIAGSGGGDATIQPGSTDFDGAAISVGQELGSFRVSTQCTFSALSSGPQRVDFYITGSLGTTAKSGSTFSFGRGTGAIRLPAATLKALKAKFTTGAYITGRVGTLNLAMTGTSQKTLNVAGSAGIPLNTAISLTGNPTYAGDLVFKVPQTSATLSGSFKVTAGAGSVSQFSLGTTAATFNVLNSAKTKVGTVSVTCQAPGKVFVDIPVS